MALENMGKKQLEALLDSTQQSLYHLEKSKRELLDIIDFPPDKNLAENLNTSVRIFIRDGSKNLERTKKIAAERLESVVKNIEEFNTKIEGIRQQLAQVSGPQL